MTEQQKLELDQMDQFLARTDTDKKILDNYIKKVSEKQEKEFLENIISSIDELYSILINIRDYIQNKEIPEIYYKIIKDNINALQVVQASLWGMGLKIDSIPNEKKLSEIHGDTVKDFYKHFDIFKFNWDFFSSIQFLTQNLVIVGANGCGKTTLAKKLKETIQEINGKKDGKGIVVSAARTMFLPQHMNIVPEILALKEFDANVSQIKDTKPPYNQKILFDEFATLINLLVAKYITTVGKQDRTTSIFEKNNTVLMRVIALWNNLISGRRIEFDSKSCGLVVVGDNNKLYSICELSDGEKAILFISSYVLLSSDKSIIIIDEPELHLHKAIVDKLFDALEKEKTDSLFIYITHDLDFAENRVNAKKLWLKEFLPSRSNKIDIECVDGSILPEELLLKVLGSKKTILFCEGKSNSLDKYIYDALLTNFTVIPVEGCQQVKNFTKAYNNLKINGKPKAYGIIDRDYNDDNYFGDLGKSCIYAHNYAEIENLLLDFELLSIFSYHNDIGNEVVNEIIDEIKKDWSKHIETEAISYVRNKLNRLLEHKTITGNSVEKIKISLNEIITEYDAEKLYKNRRKRLSKIKAYTKILQYYNKKSLVNFAKKHFHMKKFHKNMIDFIYHNDDAKAILLKLLPRELVEIGK